MATSRTLCTELTSTIRIRCTTRWLATTSKCNFHLSNINTGPTQNTPWMDILTRILLVWKGRLSQRKTRWWCPLTKECLTRSRVLIKLTRIRFISLMWPCCRRLSMHKKWESIKGPNDKSRKINRWADKLKRFHQVELNEQFNMEDPLASQASCHQRKR